MMSEMSMQQEISYEEGERILALKQIKIGDNWMPRLNEGEKLGCKYLVQRADTFIDQDPEGRNLMFVATDLYEDGVLETYLNMNYKILCLELVIEWSTHLLIGSHALSKNGIFNTNIRPSYVIVADGGQTLKLYDHGTAGKFQKFGAKKKDLFIYNRSEALDKGKIDLEGKNDVYKIACTIIYLFVMLDVIEKGVDTAKNTISEQVYRHSFFLFLQDSRYKEMADNLSENCKAINPVMQPIQSIPDPLRDLLRIMLRTNVSERPTAKQCVGEIFAMFSSFGTNTKKLEIKQIDDTYKALQDNFKKIALGD